MLSEAKLTGSQPSLHNRRLHEAVRHVSHYWFPINRQLFGRIKHGLGDGAYDLDIDFLISELKADFALFTYCVREIALYAKREGRAFAQKTSPVEMLQSAGLARIKEVLLVDERRISGHAFESSSDLQMLRIKEAVVSASTAETIAQASKIDPALGYTSGLMRQLGLALIAWNYPTVYRRVIFSLKSNKGKGIDLALSETLGFSPEVLGAALAHEWKLPAVMAVTLGAEGLVDDDVRAVGATLRKLCEVGEALARANCPEHYPTAAADWNKARTEIERYLGFEGLRVIQARVSENCQSYRALMPEVFRQVHELDAEAKFHGAQDESLFGSNPYIKGLATILRNQLRELYGDIEKGLVSKDTVRRLVKDIVPLAGFSGGLIYTLDPASASLMPRTKIGHVELRESAALALRDYTAGHDPVRAASQCTAPVIESGYGNHGELLVIAGVLGEKQRIGVLYLECALDDLDQSHELALSAFKAIRQTLNDCLGLQ